MPTAAGPPPSTRRQPRRTVAIIGAGWSGLQIAAVLSDCGYAVRVYEALDDVGGTWHPDLAYAGLGLHTPSFRAQFHGFPQPAHQPPLQRLPAAEVYATCRAFADASGVQPFIAFRHRVRQIAWDSRARLHHVTVVDEASGVTRTEAHEFVVSTQFNSPRLPHWPGQESFTGEVLHSSAMKPPVFERIARTGARVVLVGGSKAATDMALQFVERGMPFTWLLRRMYWFLSYDKGYWDFRRERPARRVYRLLYYAGLGLARGPISTRLVFAAWRLAGLLRCPGRPSPDVTAFHHGWLDERQVDTLARETTQVYDEIAALDGRLIRTHGGASIPCDALVCGTGCDPIASPITLLADSVPVDYSAVAEVYRHSVIPALPRLVFTGYWMFGFGPLNGYHRSAWLLDFIERDRSSAELLAAARADGEATHTFRRGSFLFDGQDNLLTRVKAMNGVMADGLYTQADLRRYYRDIALAHVYAPIAGADRFIAARRQPPSAPPP